MTGTQDQQIKTEQSGAQGGVEALRRELVGEISRLNGFSTRGIKALALFLVISILAWRDFPLMPTPDSVTALLGNPPSPRMIGIVLLLYTFSAIILSLGRMTSGVEHRSSFCHVGYLTAFYLFYFFGKSLGDNFWAVFGAGITILGVESYRIWTFCSEGITQKKEDVEYIARTGRVPPQE